MFLPGSKYGVTKKKTLFEPGVGAYSLSMELAGLSALRRNDTAKFVEISRKA